MVAKLPHALIGPNHVDILVSMVLLDAHRIGEFE